MAYNIVLADHNSQKIITLSLDKVDSGSKDSLNIFLNRNIDSLKSYLEDYKKELVHLNTVRDDMLRIRNEESYYAKLYISLVAVILVVAGFFGFKSIFEIKNRISEAAEITAEKVANNVAKDVLTKKYISKQFDKAFEAARDVYETQLQEIEEELDDFNNRLDVVENPDKYSQTKDKDDLKDKSEG